MALLAGALDLLGRGECNIFRLLVFTVQPLTAEVLMERDEEGETDI